MRLIDSSIVNLLDDPKVAILYGEYLVNGILVPGRGILYLQTTSLEFLYYNSGVKSTVSLFVMSGDDAVGSNPTG